MAGCVGIGGWVDDPSFDIPKGRSKIVKNIMLEPKAQNELFRWVQSDESGLTIDEE
ncbi:hypothetical protein DFQ28_000387, partial [Apophysomyces sp. BC1034]